MVLLSKSIFPYRDGKGKEHESYHLGSTESLDELHRFAQSIGMRREWFQDKLIPHYDVFGIMIQKAKEAGAEVVESRVFLQRVHRTARETIPVRDIRGEITHVVTKES